MTARIKLLIAGTTIVLIVGMMQIQAGDFLIKKEDVPKAIAQLRSGTPEEKARAASDLGRRGSVRASDVKEAVEPLRTAARNDKEAKVRAAAAKALGLIAIEPKETAKLMLDILRNKKEENQVKMAAMIAVGSLGPDGRIAVPEIRKIARDKEQKQLSRTARMVLKSINKK